MKVLSEGLFREEPYRFEVVMDGTPVRILLYAESLRTAVREAAGNPRTGYQEERREYMVEVLSPPRHFKATFRAVPASLYKDWAGSVKFWACTEEAAMDVACQTLYEGFAVKDHKRGLHRPRARVHPEEVILKEIR